MVAEAVRAFSCSRAALDISNSLHWIKAAKSIVWRLAAGFWILVSGSASSQLQEASIQITHFRFHFP